MSRTDLVSDALAIIRNALNVKRDEVLIPHSKVLIGVLEIFKDSGYIDACTFFYDAIAVDKFSGKGLSQLTTDGRFTCPHRADEEDVLFAVHKKRVRQKPHPCKSSY